MEQQVVTGLEVQKRNKKRVNVYLDEEYAFSLTLQEAARLHKGQTLSEQEVEQLREQDTVIRAVDEGARFLSFRPRSEREVRRSLAEKEHPPEVIDEAIERLQTLGYLDDLAFAKFWVRDRSAFKPVSPRALRYELRQKGVSDAIIAEVVADVDADDAAYRAAEGHLRKLHGLDKKEFRNKLNGFLQRRGFSFGDARRVIERLIEELELEDPDYFSGDE